MSPWVLLAFAYALGATPTSFWVGRTVYGVDLRDEGSGNLGATNAYRVLGARAAIPVLLFDVFKGWAPVALLPLLAVRLGGAELSDGMVLALAGAAIGGHVFSFWVRFRGGKGVATSTGALLALAPGAVLAGFLGWLVLVGITRTVSVGSIAAALIVPIAVRFTPHAGGTAMVWFTAGLGLFVIWAHRSNIGRLVRGEEPRFGGAPRSSDNGVSAKEST